MTEIPTEPQAEVETDTESRSRLASPRLWAAVVIAIIVLGFVTVVLWRTFVPSADVWTDDAQLAADYTTVAPRINGQVARVLVDDNEYVTAGQPLVEIDPRTYRVAVENAVAHIAAADAQIANVQARIAQLPALIAQAEAQVKSDQVNETFARRNATRYRLLARSGGETLESSQRQDSTAQSLTAQRQADQALLASVRKQTAVLEAQRQAAMSQRQQANADLDQAKLNLSYTTITAPVSGVVGERAAREGAWVNPGSALLAVVPLHAIYVGANYQETAITHVMPGQPVTVRVDAFPGLRLQAHVASIAPATGVTFSPIAADNATGNFTKITQRLPVKIVFEPNQHELKFLHVGLSVETTIHTDPAEVNRDRGIAGTDVAPTTKRRPGQLSLAPSPADTLTAASTHRGTQVEFAQMGLSTANELPLAR